MKRRTATERYLQRATRGLWGRKRLEVREELETHLFERVSAHRIAGLNEADATERALAELGSPQQVSVGMARIYTLPTVMGSSLALVALFLAVVALWPKSMAQTLEGMFYWPSEPCVKALAHSKPQQQESTCFTFGNEFWVSRKALQAALEPEGVKFAQVGGPAVEMLKLSVPGTTPVYIPLSSSEGYDDTVFLDDKSYKKSADYLSLWGLVAKLALNDDTALRVSGWSEPTVRLNDIDFDLDDGAGRLKGETFYETYLHGIFKETMQNRVWDMYRGVYALNPQDLNALARDSENLTAALGLRQLGLGQAYLQDGVYGTITYIDTPKAFADDFEEDDADNRQESATFLLQIARPTEAGTLTVRMPEYLETQPDFRTSFDFGELKPGDSILFLLTGGNSQTGGWYEVVSPETVSLEPQ